MKVFKKSTADVIEEPLGPNTKRYKGVCPDCRKKRMITNIAGVILSCQECTEERQRLNALKEETNWLGTKHLNDIMRNGPTKFLMDIGNGKYKWTKSKRASEVIFILDDGTSEGCVAEHALDLFLGRPEKVVGVLVKPSNKPLTREQWMKEWKAARDADQPSGLQSVLKRVME